MPNLTFGRAARGVVAVAAALALSIGGLTPAHAWGPAGAPAPDRHESEDNNSTAKANALPLDEVMQGSTYRANASDSDYYYIDLAEDGKTTLDFQFPTLSSTSRVYELEIHNSSGTELYGYDLDASDHDGARVRSRAIYLAAGRYYVKVYGASNWASRGEAYTLKVTHKPGYVEREPNNESKLATQLKLGTQIQGTTFKPHSSDSDYYYVDVPESTLLGVEFTFPKLQSTGRLYEMAVLNSSGKTLYSWNLLAADYNGSGTVTLPKGRNYIKIYGASNWASRGEPYTLRLYNVLSPAPVPTLSGTVKVGKTLTAKTGTWGPKPVSLKYQWYADGKKINGATGTKLKLTAAQRGKKITVKVTGTKSGYKTVTKTSKATAKVAPATFSKTPTPKISGTAKVGKKLTAKPGTWSPKPKLSYQWYANGSKIKGATKSTFKITSQQKNKKITVKVTGKKTAYQTVTKTSKATAKVKK
jgi:hypothetical protein